MPQDTTGPAAELEPTQDLPEANPAPFLATTCPVCGQWKPRRWSLCYDCLHTYGGKASGWPEWAREAVNANRRERYANEQTRRHELYLGDFETPGAMRAWLSKRGLDARGDEPLSYVADGLGLVPLPFAPYTDKPMNRLYSKVGEDAPGRVYYRDRHCKRAAQDGTGWYEPTGNYTAEAMNRAYRRSNGIRPIRTPQPPTTKAQDATGAAIAEHKPKSRHYDAHNPNLPAGWWGSGSWLRQGAEPTEPRGRLLTLLASAELLDLENQELARQVWEGVRDRLTDRQAAVMVGWLQGETLAAIGRRLGIGRKTAAEHCHRALEMAQGIAAELLQIAPAQTQTTGPVFVPNQ